LTDDRRLAPLRARTLDLEARTVEATISTGADVARYGFRPDETFGPWIERLDLDGADLSRMAGAPVLLDHVQAMAARVGIVEGAERRGGEIVARLKFSDSDAGRAIVRDLEGGLPPQISIGYAVGEWERNANA
jgi:hypothetical protein